MLWILFILGLILGLLLFLPIRLEIDTTNDTFRLNWQGILKFWIESESGDIKGFMKLFFWTIPLSWENRTGIAHKKPVKRPRDPNKKSRFRFKQGLALFRKVWRAIHLKKLKLDWDTGDFPLNARLYPVFRQLSQKNRQLSTNFCGNQILILQLQTRLGALILAFLQVFVTLKIK